jgi:hypothetical protein
MRQAPVGCPFAPRCAWRIDRCWSENPALAALRPDGPIVTTGAGATHRIACFNPPTEAEAAAGRPLRDGFVAAPPPAEAIDELSGRIGSSVDSEAMLLDITREEGPISMGPSAGALPLPPEKERHNDGL